MFNCFLVKNLSLALLLVLNFGLAEAQNVNISDLLKKVHLQVGNLHTGEYVLTETYTLLNIGEDTTIRKHQYKSYFQENPSDTIVGYKLSCFEDIGHETIYDGAYLYDNLTWRKELTVTPLATFPQNIKALNDNQFISFFRSVDHQLHYYINHPDLILFKGFEDIDYEKCYKLQINQGNNTLIFYIGEKSLLPVKSIVTLKSQNGKATRLMIFENKVAVVTLNQPINPSLFTKEALSFYKKEVEFKLSKDESAPLLSVGAIAPDWELPSITAGTVKLSNLKGKIVVMDFWFKACIPCQTQMADLEKLNEKANKEKVVFVGINTVDDPVKDKLKLFLTNRNITMQSVYNGKTIEPLYKVVSSPVLYVIGKDQKILYILDGYSNTLIADITKIIDQNL